MSPIYYIPHTRTRTASYTLQSTSCLLPPTSYLLPPNSYLQQVLEVSAYTRDEKIHIASTHLLPRMLHLSGLPPKYISQVAVAILLPPKYISQVAILHVHAHAHAHVHVHVYGLPPK